MRLLLTVAAACWCVVAPLCSADGQSTTADGIDRANMDTTCSACSDFFEFANGGWIRTAKIPPNKTSLGSFGVLSDKNEAVVHAILDDDAAAVHSASVRPGTNQWKVGTFYESCMDSVGIAARGIEPLRPTLDAISRIRNVADLVREFAATEQRNGLAPFAMSP